MCMHACVRLCHACIHAVSVEASILNIILWVILTLVFNKGSAKNIASRGEKWNNTKQNTAPFSQILSYTWFQVTVNTQL